jgi:hypothetical protein
LWEKRKKERNEIEVGVVGSFNVLTLKLLDDTNFVGEHAVGFHCLV